MWIKCIISFSMIFMFISFFGCSSFKYASIEKQNRISERVRINFNELDEVYTDEEEDQLINYFNQNELNRIYKEIGVKK